MLIFIMKIHDKSTISKLILSHAKKIFSDSFVEKTQKEPKFIQQFLEFTEESSTSNANSLTIQSWYEACLKETEASVIAYCRTCMEAAKVPNDKIDLLIREITVAHDDTISWMNTGLQVLRNQYYMLDVLKEQHKNRLFSFAIESYLTPIIQKTWHNNDTDKMASLDALLEYEDEIKQHLRTIYLDPNTKVQHQGKMLPFSEYYASFIAEHLFETNDKTLNQVVSILNCVHSGNEPRDYAIRRMKEWIKENFKVNSRKDQKIVNDFFTIYQQEKRLLADQEKIFKAGLLSQQALDSALQTARNYYETLIHCCGTRIEVESQKPLKQLTALNRIMAGPLSVSEQNVAKIETFFIFWFIALNEKDFPRMRELYAQLLDEDKKLLPWITTTVRNFMSNKAILKNGTHEKNISPYEINSIFLYAILQEPDKWMKGFEQQLKMLIAHIKEGFISSNDNPQQRTNAQQLKRDSYPPLLMEQLDYLMKQREWVLTFHRDPTKKPQEPTMIVSSVQFEKMQINHEIENSAVANEIPSMVATVNVNIENTRENPENAGNDMNEMEAVTLNDIEEREPAIEEIMRRIEEIRRETEEAMRRTEEARRRTEEARRRTKEAMSRHIKEQKRRREEETSEEEELKQSFMDEHKKKMDAEFNFFKKTTMTSDMCLEDILTHAINNKNRSRKVCVALKWLNSDGTIHDSAPDKIFSILNPGVERKTNNNLKKP